MPVWQWMWHTPLALACPTRHLPITICRLRLTTRGFALPDNPCPERSGQGMADRLPYPLAAKKGIARQPFAPQVKQTGIFLRLCFIRAQAAKRLLAPFKIKSDTVPTAPSRRHILHNERRQLLRHRFSILCPILADLDPFKKL